MESCLIGTHTISSHIYECQESTRHYEELPYCLFTISFNTLQKYNYFISLPTLELKKTVALIS